MLSGEKAADQPETIALHPPMIPFGAEENAEVFFRSDKRLQQSGGPIAIRIRDNFFVSLPAA